MFTQEMVELTSQPMSELWERLRQEERIISQSRARQLALLREIGRRSGFARSISSSDVAAHLDLSTDTAKALLQTADATPERSPRMASLASGEWSFDRTTAFARLVQAGAEPDMIDAAHDHDIAGIHRLRAMTTRIRRRDERQAFKERHVRSFSSLDESVGFLNAQLPAHDWKLVTDALEDRADRLPSDDGSTREQLRADALVAMAMDSLGAKTADHQSPGSTITITVDADLAARSGCELGGTIVGGPRIGPNLLAELMCEGSVEIVLSGVSGVPVAVGPTTRVVPPKVRRMVLARDGACTVDGCGNRYRLEVHHILPRGEGGSHDLDNLTTLCWWHHHVAIHGTGMQICPSSPTTRRRLISRSHDPP